MSPKKKKPVVKAWVRKPSDLTFNRQNLQRVESTDADKENKMASKAEAEASKLPVTGEMKQLFAEQFEILLANVDQIMDRRLTPISAHLKNVEDKVNTNSTEINKLTQELKNVQTELSKNTTVLQNITGDISALNSQVADNVASIKVQKQQQEVMQKKLIYMEDYSRRSNIKLINFEIKKTTDMKQEVMDYLNQLLPTPLPEELFERIHFIGRSRGATPRPIMVKFVRFADKQKIIAAIKASPDLLKRGSQIIQVFQDFSKETADWRKSFKPVTAILIKNNVRYNWGHPVFLKVWKGTIMHRIDTVEEGIDLLKAWNIWEEPQKGFKVMQG